MTFYDNAGRPHAAMPISEDSGLPLYRAAIKCGHTITEDSVTLYRDETKEGNALSQLADRLDAATAAQPIAPAADVSAPSEAVRKFLTDCAATSGGMVNGNNLARYAKRLLDAAPTGESLPVQGVPEGGPA